MGVWMKFRHVGEVQYVQYGSSGNLPYEFEAWQGGKWNPVIDTMYARGPRVTRDAAMITASQAKDERLNEAKEASRILEHNRKLLEEAEELKEAENLKKKKKELKDLKRELKREARRTHEAMEVAQPPADLLVVIAPVAVAQARDDDIEKEVERANDEARGVKKALKESRKKYAPEAVLEVREAVPEAVQEAVPTQKQRRQARRSAQRLEQHRAREKDEKQVEANESRKIQTLDAVNRLALMPGTVVQESN